MLPHPYPQGGHAVTQCKKRDRYKFCTFANEVLLILKGQAQLIRIQEGQVQLIRESKPFLL